MTHSFSPRVADRAVDEVVRINTKVRDFWQSGGWAPAGAAALLMRGRLDRQASLSHCLRLWLTPPPSPPSPAPKVFPWGGAATSTQATDASADGRLILAWANLGCLVEGTLKFFLCVYEHDYAASPGTKGRAMSPIDPDELQLEALKQYFRKNVLVGPKRDRWSRYVALVQRRRNAIHAYQDREIGTAREFYVAVKNYVVFLKSTEGGVPYPDQQA